ncbi:defensin beta 136 [Pteropus medius]|uniref:beta-defensin 136 n=1 Tax=Pteropus vampyrus TaxID=132908 RepID=UPI00196A9020|nr:beta-defensin 136 [Pteropus giganteus]
MRLCLSGLLFLLVISLPSGNGFLKTDGAEIYTCTLRGGKCFLGCKLGWKWIAFCHNVMSCCKVAKHKPYLLNEQ